MTPTQCLAQSYRLQPEVPTLIVARKAPSQLLPIRALIRQVTLHLNLQPHAFLHTWRQERLWEAIPLPVAMNVWQQDQRNLFGNLIHESTYSALRRNLWLGAHGRSYLAAYGWQSSAGRRPDASAAARVAKCSRLASTIFCAATHVAL